MSTSKGGLSLAALDARKAGEQPFEFEYIDGEGNHTGVFLSVYGSECDLVQTRINKELNERRRKARIAEAKNRSARPDSAEFTPIEDDIAFGQRLAAVRIAGWRGITEDFTPERALQLCQTNPDISAQVIEAANRTSNFLKLSSPI